MTAKITFFPYTPKIVRDKNVCIQITNTFFRLRILIGFLDLCLAMTAKLFSPESFAEVPVW